MALYKPSALAAEISGTVGGMNFARGRNGLYIRKIAVRVNRRTAAQLEQRTHPAIVQAAWQNLDADLRLLWMRLAERFTYPNRLGINRPRSGYILFSTWYSSWWDIAPAGAELYPEGAATNQEELLVNPWPIGGDWEISISRAKSLNNFCIVQCARPVSSIPRTSFRNWREAYRGEIQNLWFPIGSAGNYPAFLENAAAGEVIGVRAKIGSPGQTGMMLFSPWAYAQTTITT